MTARNPLRHERGVSLAGALMLVALMSVIAMTMATELRFAMRRSLNMEVRDQAHWYALGARDYTEALLERVMAEPASALRPDAAWLQGPQFFPIEQGQLAGEVRDGNNCFNLNGLVTQDERGRTTADARQQRRFEAMMQAAGLPPQDAARIAAQAVDWLDTDSRPSSSGAEDPAYAEFAMPYRAANTLMVEREEMLALPAVTPAIYAELAPLVCVRPVAEPLALNINTLQASHLPLLIGVFEGRLPRATAETILLQRPLGGFADEDAFWTLDQIASLEPDASLRETVGVSTRYFEIDIDVLYAGARYELSEVVEIRGAGRPIRVSQRFGMFS